MDIQLWLGRSPRSWMVLALVWALTAPPAAGGMAAPSVADAFAHDVAATGVPGGVVAHIDGGRVVERRSVGDVKAGSRFLWGSVSKPLAGAVASTLAAQGRLDLSAPASHLVDGAPDVPVQDLMNHTGGLGFGADVLDVDRPAATAISVAGQHPAHGTAGSSYAYSSLDYLFVQAVVERVTGHPYEQAVRDRFPGTRIGASATACSDVTRPHRLVGPWAMATSRRYDGAGAGYGYTCGSIDDLAAVAIDHLQHPPSLTSVPTGHPGQRYADGWRITTEPDGRITHWHTGTVPGYFSAVYLDPTAKDGTVVLLDASGYLHEQQLAALTRSTFDRATGRAPSRVPSATAATAFPCAVLAAALGLLLCALRQRAGRRWIAMTWGAAVLVLVAGLAALPALTGYPYRYVWLWEPSLVLAALPLALALALGVLTSVGRGRIFTTPSLRPGRQA